MLGDTVLCETCDNSNILKLLESLEKLSYPFDISKIAEVVLFSIYRYLMISIFLARYLI